MPDNNRLFKLIKAKHLVDGTRKKDLEYGAILLENDKIMAVGSEKDVIPPEGAIVEEFNYTDKTVLPGLIDCHVHLIGMGDGRTGDELATLPDEILTLQAAQNAHTHLLSGVTTVRDCGAKNHTTFMLRKAVEMGIATTPRLILSGRPLSIIGGHLSYFGIEATGEDECRATVRQLVKEGADFIKITATGGSTKTSFKMRPSFTVPELKAICEEAHKFGIHTAAHCVSTQGMVNAIDAGVDTIIHAMFKEPDGTSRYRPEVAERIAKQNIFVNPTLHSIGKADILRLEAKLASDGLTEEDEHILDISRRGHEYALDCFAKMREIGIEMVAGSDAAWERDKMGMFQYEIDAFVSGGMSASEAIIAATSSSAKSCWIDDITGTLEIGKQGDLLVVDGNPSKDIKTLWNVVEVFQNGNRVSRNSSTQTSTIRSK